MRRIIHNTKNLISVTYLDRIIQRPLLDYLEEQSFQVSNSFHGNIHDLVPRSPSGHYGIEVVFFRSNKKFANDILYQQYVDLGLTPDPIAQIRANSDFPEIAKNTNICQWTYRAGGDYLSPSISIENKAGYNTATILHAERGSLWEPNLWFCGTRPLLPKPT